MSAEQEKTLVKLLESITHCLVQTVRDLGHDERVHLLDELCAVKREFGVAEEMPDKT